MSLLFFCDIVFLVYDGDDMKKKCWVLYIFTLILLTVPTVVKAYGRVSAPQSEESKAAFIGILLYLSPLIIVAAIGFVLYLNRAHERAKKNVEDRNLTGAHAALDVRNVKDREFIEYIEATEDKTDLYLANFFDNITNLEYIKARSSEALYNNIVEFLDNQKKNGKYLIIKETVVHHNEINVKKENYFSADIIIECFNYLEDHRGNYLCGYKIKKEFVRKRIEFEMYKDKIVLISIEDM